MAIAGGVAGCFIISAFHCVLSFIRQGSQGGICIFTSKNKMAAHQRAFRRKFDRAKFYRIFSA
jgi:hypothetical protein